MQLKILLWMFVIALIEAAFGWWLAQGLVGKPGALLIGCLVGLGNVYLLLKYRTRWMITTANASTRATRVTNLLFAGVYVALVVYEFLSRQPMMYAILLIYLGAVMTCYFSALYVAQLPMRDN